MAFCYHFYVNFPICFAFLTSRNIPGCVEPLEQGKVLLVGERGEAAPLAAAEELAEEPLELLAEDAVDDEVDGGVERDEEVGDGRQLRHLDVQHLKRRENEENILYLQFYRVTKQLGQNLPFTLM